MENVFSKALSPPVRLLREESAPAAPTVPPPAPLDVEWERRLVADAASCSAPLPGASIREVLQAQAASSVEAQDGPQDGPQEDLRLAVALVGEKRAPGFATSLSQLRGMGFDTAAVCGALLESEGDPDRAANRLAS